MRRAGPKQLIFHNKMWAWRELVRQSCDTVHRPVGIDSSLDFPRCIAEIAVMGRELDRCKGSGRTHDAERDTEHYVDLADDRSVEGAAAVLTASPGWGAK